VAASIDWPSGVITIQQSDTSLLTQLSATLYRLDTNALRLDLKNQEDSSEGMAWTRTHSHNGVVVIGGLTLVRTISILTPYSIIFLPDSQWSVQMDGATNNNYADVQGGILVQNQVQVITANSAGNTVTETGVSGLTIAESAALLSAAAEALLARKLIDADRVLTEGDSSNMEWIDADDGTTVLRIKDVKDKGGSAITLTDGAPAEERRS